MKKEYDSLNSKVGGYAKVLNNAKAAVAAETDNVKIALKKKDQKKAQAKLDIATSRMTELKTTYLQMVDDKKTRDQEQAFQDFITSQQKKIETETNVLNQKRALLTQKKADFKNIQFKSQKDKEKAKIDALEKDVANIDKVVKTL